MSQFFFGITKLKTYISQVTILSHVKTLLGICSRREGTDAKLPHLPKDWVMRVRFQHQRLVNLAPQHWTQITKSPYSIGSYQIGTISQDVSVQSDSVGGITSQANSATACDFKLKEDGKFHRMNTNAWNGRGCCRRKMTIYEGMLESFNLSCCWR